MASRHSKSVRIYFKVLSRGGGSCHGGRLRWSLPNRRAGGWHCIDYAKELMMCHVGLHVTDRPLMWLGAGRKRRRIFICEVSEQRVTRDCWNHSMGDKICVRRARLLREIPNSLYAVVREHIGGRVFFNYDKTNRNAAGKALYAYLIKARQAYGKRRQKG